MANIVAIVGRPNVGKSTLFNRLVEQRQAIMDNESGVTRDRQYGYGEWSGKFFTVIDTGGYVHGSDDVFEGAIRKQVKSALEEASVILFMVDTVDGLTGLDKDFANVVRTVKKPVIVVANKADNTKRSQMTGEFYALGLGEVYPVSAVNGSGTGDVLDEVIKEFKEDTDEDPESGLPKIAIMGRPNVGKSSFLNVLVGEERSIVTDIAGTTRDAIHTRYNLFGKDFILSDTAGVRKKTKVKENIEFYSVIRSIKALQNSDISIIILDAQHGLEAQDMNLIQLAVRHKKGIVLMVNKWDLIEKDQNTINKFRDDIREKLGVFQFIPIIFTSVLNKQRVFKVIETAMEVYENRHRKIPTSALNEKLLPEIERTPPPAIKGKHIKIKYITQLPTKSPTFAFFCNHPNYIKAPYERFLENRLRENFNFEGVPVKLVFRNK
jgi:GTP-binding protein